MELMEVTSKPAISRKRPLVQAVRDFPPGCGFNVAERKPVENTRKVHSNPVEANKFNSPKTKEFGGNKTYVVSRPSGKVKFWDPGCTKTGFDQKPKVTITHEPPRKVLKRDNIVASNGKDKLVKSQPVENCKLESSVPKELGRNKSYLGSRSTRKVKFWDPNCEPQKPEEVTVIVSEKERIRREKIQHAMAVFDEMYEPFYEENKLKPKNERISGWRCPMEAAKIVKRKLKWIDSGKMIGHVCGVQIGDTFKYRAQLMMIGLHTQPQSGIDYANINGKNLAISIVDAHRYSNESGSSDTLVYSGQGGISLFGSNKLPPEDQKLVRGNLAMKNSKDKKTEVRVIRKVGRYGKEVFVYDGLYIVDDCKNEKSGEGKLVFKFHLKRVPGQPSLQKMLKW